MAANFFLPVHADDSVPEAKFSVTLRSGTAPLTVRFHDASTHSPTAWYWVFGDGGISTEQNPEYTYTTAGLYTVSLTATNAAGSSSKTRTDLITVTDVALPLASFSADTLLGQVPLTVTFTDASTHDPTAWVWTFGDGYSSTLENPSHTYTTAGSYTVSLTVTNAGGSDTVTKTSCILATADDAPVASFTADPLEGNAPLTVQFADTSENEPAAWYWVFGDGGTSTEQNPVHEYEDEGTYTVTLTVTNDAGSDTTEEEGYIVVGDVPEASFTADVASGTVPLVVQFTDTSANEPDEWYWSFGDGFSSVYQNPSHTYTSAGSYTVTLTATNAAGDNTIRKSLYITVSAAPAAAAAPDTSSSARVATTRTTVPATPDPSAESATEPASEEFSPVSLPVIGGIALIIAVAVGCVVIRKSGQRARRWEL